MNGFVGGLVVLLIGVLSTVMLKGDPVPAYIGLIGFALCGSLEVYRHWKID